jgi:serine/threonine protein kinase
MKPVKLNDDEDREIIKESRGPGMPIFYRTPDLVSYYRNEKTITTASDVYQLGLVLAQLFTGRNPMKLPPRNEKGEFMFDAPIEREEIGWILGDFGPEIKNLIEQMIEEDASKRPKAHQLVDWWEEVFRETVNAHMKVEGRVL